MSKRLVQLLSRLFAVAPGEESKTFLLFSLHTLFYLGLRWGDNASTALFIDHWSAQEQALLFVGIAILSVVVGALYTRFVARLGNAPLLVTLLALLLSWLVSVQLLAWAGIGVGERGWWYLYFALGFSALGDIAAVHIIVYMSDFYDTRAAKRALPVLLSASAIGSIAAWLGSEWVKSFVQLTNVPLLWAILVGGMLGLVAVIQNTLPEAKLKAATPRTALTVTESGLALLRERPLVLWLALSMIILVVLLRLLTLQANVLFKQTYTGDLFELYSLLDGLGNIAGFFLGALFTPIMERVGVGGINLFFPVLTLIVIGVMNFGPLLVSGSGFAAAILGRLTERVFKKIFRNPVEALLINGLPARIKGVARGFINAWMVPLGTLLAGGLSLAATQFKWLSNTQLTWIGMVFGVLFVALAVKVRAEYRRALEDLVADDELSVFRSDQYEYEFADDPEIVRQLEKRIADNRDNDSSLYLSEMLYDLRGRDSLKFLCAIADTAGPALRAHVIQLLGNEWITDPAARRLCQAGLRDPAREVQAAAVAVLAHAPSDFYDTDTLNALLELLDVPDDELQALALPCLINSGDFYYLAPAVERLASWVAEGTPTPRRILGLQALAQTGDERLVRTLARFARDPSVTVRAETAELLGRVAGTAQKESLRVLGETTLNQLLDERDEEGVRERVAYALGYFKPMQIKDLRLKAWRDPVFAVRRAACERVVMPRRELEKLIARPEAQSFEIECALYLLSRTYPSAARRRLLDWCAALTQAAYHRWNQSAALHALNLPYTNLFKSALAAQADHLIERIFWLLSATQDEDVLATVQRNLRTNDKAMQANSLETLETLSSPQLARWLTPLLITETVERRAEFAKTYFNLGPLPLRQIFAEFESPDLTPQVPALAKIESSEWLAAVALTAQVELIDAGRLGEALTPQGPRPARQHLTERLRHLAEGSPSLLQQVALNRLTRAKTANATAEETLMLTLIEKVLFLKQTPFFKDIPTDYLRLLAGVCEEAQFTARQTIIHEGEPGEAMFIILRGKVTIEHQSKNGPEKRVTQLAHLGVNDSVGEMSLFDGEPYSADVIAAEPTHLLVIRHAPLMALINRQPGLALGVVKVFTQRLRAANLALAQQR